MRLPWFGRTGDVPFVFVYFGGPLQLFQKQLYFFRDTVAFPGCQESGNDVRMQFIDGV